MCEKDWQGASKACAAVLKQDQNSYLGWVLMGLAMNHIDINKSVQSYQKAVAIDESQPTAWQGLIKLITDLPDPTNAQLEILKDALYSFSEKALSADHNKQSETLTQLATISTKLLQYQQVSIQS